MKARILIITGVLLLVLILAIGFYLINSSKNAINQSLSSNQLTLSYPVSSSATNTNKKIAFQDKSISPNYSSDNLFSVDCIDPSKENPAMELSNYRFGPSGSDSGFADVALNMSKYRNQNEILKNGYDFVDKILDQTYSLGDFKDNGIVQKIFGVPCSGESALPVTYLEKVNYPGTQNAFAFLVYGSSQSTVDANSPIVYVYVIANIDDNYIQLVHSPDYPSKEDFLDSSEDLKVCEKDSSYGYKYIPIFEKEGADCVRNVYQNHINKTNFDKFVSELINNFRLL